MSMKSWIPGILILSCCFNFGAVIHPGIVNHVPGQAMMRKQILGEEAVGRQAFVVEASGMQTREDRSSQGMADKDTVISTVTDRDANEGREKEVRQAMVVDASGHVRVDTPKTADITDWQPEVVALYKRFHAPTLPAPCAEFFNDDCKLNLPPDGDNLTEIEDAFLFCCEDSEHGGHNETTCKSLVMETFTKINEVTEEECNTLVDLYVADRDLQQDHHHDDTEEDHNETEEDHLSERQNQLPQAEGAGNASMLDMALRNKGAPPAPTAPRTENGRITIGSSPVLVQGNDGNKPIVIFYHGMQQTCDQCPHLRHRLEISGYTVISPCDHNMNAALAIWNVGDWGNRVYNDVTKWQNHRKIGVLGYSMGGGAAIKVSFDNGGRDVKVPVVAFHPASILAGWGFASGPTLYTTGDGEDFEGSARYAWQTSSATTWHKYHETSGTKLYLKFRNADHGFPCWQAPEWDAAVKWFDCYIKGESHKCPKQNYCGISQVMECVGLDR